MDHKFEVQIELGIKPPNLAELPVEFATKLITKIFSLVRDSEVELIYYYSNSQLMSLTIQSKNPQSTILMIHPNWTTKIHLVLLVTCMIGPKTTLMMFVF